MADALWIGLVLLAALALAEQPAEAAERPRRAPAALAPIDG
jgi:hypothetical protein